MKDFKKYFSIGAAPEDVFNALTHEGTIQLWSGEKAEMNTIPGADFNLFDGSINGKNIEFIPGKKIVQEWYFGDQDEKSVVTIILHAAKDGTSAEVRHTNIPDADFENISMGWIENYFGALIDFYRT